jgi:hypothetical protein
LMKSKESKDTISSIEPNLLKKWNDRICF